MLQSTQEEINEIREYFRWQAPDLEISFMQKIYSESVLGARHDVWDIHTNKDHHQSNEPLLTRAVSKHGSCGNFPHRLVHPYTSNPEADGG